MEILKKTLKIMASGIIIISGIAAAASSTVYLLPEAKSFGVASHDQKALMFLAMDKKANLKGICFAMVRQSTSLVPLVDITATTDSGRFVMHGLRPNLSDANEVVCSFGSESGDFITGISKSTFCKMKFNFNGEISSYTFDTTEFRKILTANGQGIVEKAVKDYAQGVRAPVFYDNSSAPAKNNAATSNVDTHSYKASNDKLNYVWKSLSPETRKRLLPSQREWIKNKSYCHNEQKCLTEMTNKRILELESENGK
ncbi:lysozyme inhibitor LprI family protein [Phytobacter ursingii]|nr:lysozyme inhibitor LprI family protein [Phytobacter ursingii]